MCRCRRSSTTGDGAYRLTLEILADPARDALLIRYALAGDGCALYVLLAPRLGPTARDNTAFAGEILSRPAEANGSA